MYHRATQISLSIDRVSNYFSYLVHRSENITESEGKKLREKKQKKLYDIYRERVFHNTNKKKKSPSFENKRRWKYFVKETNRCNCWKINSSIDRK